MFKRIVLFAMIAMLFLAVQAGRANADPVTNGNFATGDFTGWVLGGDYLNPAAWVAVNNDGFSFSPPAPSATYAQFGTAGAPITISQTLATTVGRAYTVSFYVMNGLPASTPNNEFQALWDGVKQIDLLGAAMSSAWTQYAFMVTGTGSDTLAFSFLQDAATINITKVSAVPLPAALLLFGPGLAGIAVLRKRFKS